MLTCDKYILNCIHCNKEYTRENENEHYEKCEEIPIECPYNCDKLIKKNKTNLHYNTECMNVYTMCDRCKIQYKFKHKKYHICNTYSRYDIPKDKICYWYGFKVDVKKEISNSWKSAEIIQIHDNKVTVTFEKKSDEEYEIQICKFSDILPHRKISKYSIINKNRKFIYKNDGQEWNITNYNKTFVDMERTEYLYCNSDIKISNRLTCPFDLTLFCPFINKLADIKPNMFLTYIKYKLKFVIKITCTKNNIYYKYIKNSQDVYSNKFDSYMSHKEAINLMEKYKLTLILENDDYEDVESQDQFSLLNFNIEHKDCKPCKECVVCHTCRKEYN